jgi:hypothetical protein
MPTTTTNNVPNLDAMTQRELMDFWCKHQRCRGYRELFPAGGKGTMRATADLACYASNKATAMACRLRGDMPAALMYEGIADRIYAELPPFAKW